MPWPVDENLMARGSRSGADALFPTEAVVQGLPIQCSQWCVGQNCRDVFGFTPRPTSKKVLGRWKDSMLISAAGSQMLLAVVGSKDM